MNCFRVLGVSLTVVLLALMLSSCKQKLEIDKKAPQLAALFLDESEAKLSYQGFELVLFWENGCKACVKTMPELDTWAKDAGIELLAINSVDEKELLENFAKEHNFAKIKIVQDKLDLSWQRYEVQFLPALFIIKDGLFKEKILGDRSAKYIKEKVKLYE